MNFAIEYQSYYTKLNTSFLFLCLELGNLKSRHDRVRGNVSIKISFISSKPKNVRSVIFFLNKSIKVCLEAVAREC